VDKVNINNPKEPWFAVNLSMFFAGIGQIYSGRIVRGCIFLFSQIVLICFGGWLIFNPAGNTIIAISLLLGTIVVHIWSLFDTHKCAKEVNTENFESSRKKDKDPWLAVFLSQILPGLGHIYLRKWIWGITLVACLIIVSIIGKTHLLFLICGPIFLAFVCYHAYMSSPVRRETSKNLILILAVVIFALGLEHNYLPVLIKENVVQAFKSSTKSMEPTLRVDDKILVKKSAQYVLKRGDVVVFKYPEDRSRSFTKRVVAFGGESIEIRDGNIYINEDKLEDPPFQNIRYVSMGEFGVEGKPFVVPDHSLFVLGDNSNISKDNRFFNSTSEDSRFFGSVPEDDLIGKAYKIYWPPNHMGPIE
jgi:signal peptidase I